MTNSAINWLEASRQNPHCMTDCRAYDCHCLERMQIEARLRDRLYSRRSGRRQAGCSVIRAALSHGAKIGIARERCIIVAESMGSYTAVEFVPYGGGFDVAFIGLDQ